MGNIETKLNPASAEPLTAERVRELWSKTYNSEGKPDWSHVLPYYHEDIVFQDAIQRVEGIEAFTALCTRLAQRSKQLTMDIHAVSITGREIFLEWTMLMMYKKWPSTPLYGCSRLTLGDDGRIIRQRDYFDLWGDIFNGIPRFNRRYRRFMQKYFG